MKHITKKLVFRIFLAALPLSGIAGELDAVVKTAKQPSGHVRIAQLSQSRAAETANKQVNIEGSFGGIGAELETNNGILRVKRIVAAGPADRAGLKAGWEIPRINGIPTAGMELNDAVKLVRGTIGTELKLEVRSPDGTSRQISLIREKVLAVAKTEGTPENFRFLAMTDKVGILSQDPKQREAAAKTVGQTAQQRWHAGHELRQ